jgi:hypothetical protein
MTQPDIAAIAKGLSKAQERDLLAVCRTNGGGLNIDVSWLDDGEIVPRASAMRKLFDKGLIQGKSNGPCRVVHTALGLAVRAHLQEKNND